jgi:hypothetical protein
MNKKEKDKKNIYEMCLKIIAILKSDKKEQK